MTLIEPEMRGREETRSFRHLIIVLSKLILSSYSICSERFIYQFAKYKLLLLVKFPKWGVMNGSWSTKHKKFAVLGAKCRNCPVLDRGQPNIVEWSLKDSTPPKISLLKWKFKIQEQLFLYVNVQEKKLRQVLQRIIWILI